MRVMRRLSDRARNGVILLGLLVLLFGVAIVSAVQQAEPPPAPPLAHFSAGADGGKALRLWLEALEYDVLTNTRALFGVPSRASVMLMLQPTQPVLDDEWVQIDRWVDQGGTLLLIGTSLQTRTALSHYDIELLYYTPVGDVQQVQTPLLRGSLQPVSAEIQPNAYLSTERDDVIIHVADADRPLLLSFDQGDGRVIVGSALFPFTNDGLQRPGNAALVLSVIEAARTTDAVWFNEWHHGIRDVNAPVGLSHWVRTQPAGQAFLLGGGIVFIALLLAGRRFGRAWTDANDVARRAPLEYITAIANLNRRAGNREAVLDSYRYRLKRSLGRRYRIDPRLADGAFLEQLQACNPALDVADVRALLDALYRTDMSERELVRISAEITDFLNKNNHNK